MVGWRSLRNSQVDIFNSSAQERGKADKLVLGAQGSGGPLSQPQPLLCQCGHQVSGSTKPLQITGALCLGLQVPLLLWRSLGGPTACPNWGPRPPARLVSSCLRACILRLILWRSHSPSPLACGSCFLLAPLRLQGESSVHRKGLDYKTCC